MDLSTYEGRQAARDAGYWVGTNSSGQIVAEPGHPGGQAGTSGGGSSGAAVAPSQPAIGGGGQDLGAAIQGMLASLASGNQKDLDEKIREFDATHGLNAQQLTASIQQFNQNLQQQQAQFTASQAQQQQQFTQSQAQQASQFGQTFGEGQRQFNVNTGMNAVQLQAGLHADPFAQVQALGGLNRLLSGQGVAGFQGLQGNAADTQSIDYILNQIRNPAQAQAQANNLLGQIPQPNQISAPDFFRSPPAQQQMVLSGIKAKYGIDPADSLAQINATLPQFRAPANTGTIGG